MNYIYFDSAIPNGILSVHCQIGEGICRNFGGGEVLISSANYTSLCWQIPV